MASSSGAIPYENDPVSEVEEDFRRLSVIEIFQSVRVCLRCG
jgi:hypothetical protein